MSEEREPVRLRDDPDADAALRAALEAARAEPSDDAMLAGVLAGVLAGGGAGRGGGGAGMSAAAKLASAIGASVLGAGAIAWMVASGLESATPPPPAHVVPLVVDAAMASGDAAPELDAGPDDAGVDAAGVAHVDRRPPPTTAPPTTAPPITAPPITAPPITAPPITAPPSTVLESDQALLFRLTRERDPARSLAIAEEHRERYPSSPLAEDREARIVEDLAALHRTREATEAAAAFRARWPRSAHLPHIESALAAM